MLSIRQAVTATAFSVDQYDTGNMGAGNPVRNIGRTEVEFRVVAQVDVSPTAAGAATVDFQLGTADDAAGTNFTVLASSGPRAIASIPAGTRVLDVEVPDHERRFLMMRYVVGTGPLTAGQFSTSLQIGSDFQRGYRRGDNPSAY